MTSRQPPRLEGSQGRHYGSLRRQAVPVDDLIVRLMGLRRWGGGGEGRSSKRALPKSLTLSKKYLPESFLEKVRRMDH